MVLCLMPTAMNYCFILTIELRCFVQVTRGLDTFLFKLLILGNVQDSSGNVWRRRKTDMYVVELTTDETFPLLTTDALLPRQSSSQVSFTVNFGTAYCR